MEENKNAGVSPNNGKVRSRFQENSGMCWQLRDLL